MKLQSAFCLLFLCATVFSADEENDSLPFIFSEGDTARAASVNENFTYLLQYIQKVKAKIDSLEIITASLNDSLAELQDKAVPKIDSIANFTSSLNDSITNLQDFRITAAKLDSLVAVTENLGNTVTNSTGRIDSIADVTSTLNGSITTAQNSIQQNDAAISDLESTTQALNDSLASAKNSLHLPIGTIIGSMLPPDKFAEQFLGDTSCWKLADSSTASSAFFEATGNSNIPDLRGVFLRGINSSRTGDLSDPDGNRAAGSSQADIFKAHSHSINQYSAGGSNPNSSWGVFDNTNRLYSSVSTASTGGNETRPRNVAIYWYIKVK